MAILAAAAGLAAFSAQVVGVAANKPAPLLQNSELVADLPLALLDFLAKPAGVHICTFISIYVYRFAHKTGPRNIFLNFFSAWPVGAVGASQE